MHYINIGNSNIHSKAYGVKAANSGFTSLLFSYSLFNIQKQKRVFFYSPMLGLAIIPSIIYDPEIMTHPDRQKKIIVTCKKTGSTNDTEIFHDFTDDELMKILIRSIIKRVQMPHQKIYRLL